MSQNQPFSQSDAAGEMARSFAEAISDGKLLIRKRLRGKRVESGGEKRGIGGRFAKFGRSPGVPVSLAFPGAWAAVRSALFGLAKLTH